MPRRDESHLLPKLKNLQTFCEKRMSASVEISDYEEWLTIKERVELWIGEAGSY